MTPIPCPACSQPIIPAYRLGNGYRALTLNAQPEPGGYAIQPGGSAYLTRNHGHQPHSCHSIHAVLAVRGMTLIVAPDDEYRALVERVLGGRLNGPLKHTQAVLETLRRNGLTVHRWTGS